MGSTTAQLIFFLFSLWPKSFRRKLWLSLRDRGQTLWPDACVGNAQKSPFDLYIKYGPNVRAQEGHAIRYLSSKTSVPVPHVYDIVHSGEETILVIASLPGETLDIQELRAMDKVQRQKIASQIKSVFTEIRSLPPPSSSVSGFLPGTPIYDSRLSFVLRPIPPSSSVVEFHRELLERARLNVPLDMKDVVMSAIEQSHSRPHRVCLTHGDLHPGNILFDEELRITGVLDWECASWMPEYWCVCIQFHLTILTSHPSGNL